MKVQVNQGQNIIKILLDDFASCLVIDKALTLNWPDCRGSVGEYYSISNNSSEEREKLTTELNSVLINGTESDILKSIGTFLNLFSNGEYEIHFYTLKIKEHSFFGRNQIIYSKSTPGDEMFSGSFYPSFDEVNIFNSIPNNKINTERIDFYINLISQGIRPKIILFESYNVNTSDYSSTYILDGHHKLEAYLKLGIDIPTVKIVKNDTEANDTEEILKYIYPILKDFEYRHFIKNNDNISNINFQYNLHLTEVVDNILLNYKNIDINIIKMLINIANSKNEYDIIWLKQRLNTLARNKYIGLASGLYVYHKVENDLGWFPFEINSQYGLKKWIKKTITTTPKTGFSLLRFLGLN